MTEAVMGTYKNTPSQWLHGTCAKKKKKKKVVTRHRRRAADGLGAGQYVGAAVQVVWPHTQQA